MILWSPGDPQMLPLAVPVPCVSGGSHWRGLSSVLWVQQCCDCPWLGPHQQAQMQLPAWSALQLRLGRTQNPESPGVQASQTVIMNTVIWGPIRCHTWLMALHRVQQDKPCRVQGQPPRWREIKMAAGPGWEDKSNFSSHFHLFQYHSVPRPVWCEAAILL